MSLFNRILVSAAVIGAFTTASPANAGDQVCGYYAFAGAFQTYRSAKRQANRYGGMVLDLDRSNSPNAGLGYFVVAKGPYRSRTRANRKARQYRYQGVRGSYAARRCFTASY